MIFRSADERTTAPPVRAVKEPPRFEAYRDRTFGVVFLVFAVFIALGSPWMYHASIFGELAAPVFVALLVAMFLFQGLGIVRRAGVWFRVGSFWTGVGSLVLSPLFVQRGLQSETPWLSVFLVTLGILFAPIGVLNLWNAYRGGTYNRRLRRTVTFDELVGR